MAGQHVFDAQAELHRSVARLRAWTGDRALPLWAERAQLSDGSWVEHLRLDGTPDHQAERRWRIVARQAVAYAQATLAGWYDGTDIARRSFEAYWQQGWTGTHMVHRILPDGTISDPRPDLYDHAFGLLACARLYQLTREQSYLDRAADIQTWLKKQAHPAGGWSEGAVKSLPRRQNPHMHLLEASLALFEATSDPADLGIAHQIIDLFKRHFRRGETVTEFFTEDWQPDPAEGDRVEPGHAVEWVWLLARYDHLAGGDHRDARHALYDRALRSRLGRLFDEERRDGEVLRETTRAWVQTELVKAHLVMAEDGVPGALDLAALGLVNMFGTVLQADGSWVDQRNACGASMAETIPVSTLYHIIGMAVEADRVARRLS